MPASATAAQVAMPRFASTTLLMSNNASGHAGFKVLMIRRHAKARFMANMYAFPGGCIEAEDGVLAASLSGGRSSPTGSPASANSPLALRIAAVRELFEETRCVVRADGTVVRVATQGPMPVGDPDGAALRPDYGCCDRLALFAHWITPKEEKYRYDTWFYGLPVEENAMEKLRWTMARQESEISNIAWMDPLEALRRHEDPKEPFMVPPPTYLFLDMLARFRSTEEVEREWARLGYRSAAAAGPSSEPLATVPEICPVLRMSEDGFIQAMLLPPNVSPYFPAGRYSYPNPTADGKLRFTELNIGGMDDSHPIQRIQH